MKKGKKYDETVIPTLDIIQNGSPSNQSELLKNTPNGYNSNHETFEKKAKDNNNNFPYKFYKSSFARNYQELDRSLMMNLEDVKINGHLLSPDSTDPMFKNVIKTYLPALVGIGTALGITFNAMINTWGKHIKKNMNPSLFYNGDILTVTYGSSSQRKIQNSNRDMINIIINNNGKLNQF